jgi:hypothetical protein
MIRLPTQFDPPGTHAVEAAIPGGSCCCCCCCCLATTVSVSAVAAIQASRQAGEAKVRPAHADLWVGLAGAALIAAAIIAAAVASAISAVAPSSPSVAVFVLGTVIVWAVLLWAAFHGVGFKHPVVRAAAFTLIGIIAFGIEAIAAGPLVLYGWPLYLFAAAAVIGLVLWNVRKPRVPPPSSENLLRQ